MQLWPGHSCVFVCVCVEGGRGRGSQQFSDVLVLVCCACKMSHQPPQHSTLHFNRVCAPGLAGRSHCPAETPGVLREQVQESAMSVRTSAIRARMASANEWENHWRRSPPAVRGTRSDPWMFQGFFWDC